MDLTAQQYADYNVIVTTKAEVDGTPTLPLSFALDMADQLAEYDEPES